MKTGTMDRVEAETTLIAYPLGDLATSQPEQSIDLRSCAHREWIVVTTQTSVYDVIVLTGETGEVMIRGGRCLPEFQRAIVAGSTFGGSALKLRSICVGLYLEFRVDGKPFVTSRLEAVSPRGTTWPSGDLASRT